LFILSIIGFVIGAVLGSFSNAMIHRIPLGVSMWKKTSESLERSVCIHCGHQLSWKDLVPLISWLCLVGRCRYCRKAIGARYLIVEILSALLCAVFLLLFGVSWLSLLCILLTPFFITMIVIFLRYRKVSMLKSLCFMIIGVSITVYSLFLLLP
jgi:leader peptidase (prepilin peptidase)/N-methyltransferase